MSSLASAVTPEPREFEADEEDAKAEEEGDSHVQKNDDGSTTILFDHPLVLKDKSKDPITEITLKRPTVGDLESSDVAKGDVKKTLLIISSLSGLSPAILRRIDLEDFKRISTFINKALGGTDEKKSPATGEE